MVGRYFTDNDATAFRELLQLSGMRGIDSTGIYFCDTEGKKLLIAERKETINSLDFVDKHGWHEGSLLYRTDFNLYMGHTRSKTIGHATLENCHPFNLSRYVGAHNGSLNDWEFTFGNGGKTDSEMMFQKMDDIGEYGPQEVLEELDPMSAYAVTIFDKVKRRVIFARNRKRPLWVAINKKRPVLYWASEERFLDFVADSNNLDVNIYYFAPFCMYTVDIAKFKMGDMTPWTIHKLTEKQPPKKYKQQSSIWFPEYSKDLVLDGTEAGTSTDTPPITSVINNDNVIRLNASTGLTSPVMISGVTDFFNASDHADARDGASLVQEAKDAREDDDLEFEAVIREATNFDDIDWNDVANHS